MNEIELLRSRFSRRYVTECAPHALERTGLRIQDDHTLVAVSIRHKHFAAIKEGIRGLVQIPGVRVASALIPATDLHEELTFVSKLQKHVVRVSGRKWRAISIIPANPDIPSGIDVDSMFAFRPVVCVVRAAPTRNETSCCIEL